MSTPGSLHLQDGRVFEGWIVGFDAGICGGELCFNTSMTGYQEMFTDPSYRGQMLVHNFVHLGNYGAYAADQESDRVQISGVVVRNFTEKHSRLMADSSLPDSSLPAAKAGPTAVTRRLTSAMIRGNRSGNVDQGMGQGMEMALTIAVFLGIGWGLDVWLGTQPIFMIALVIFSTVGQFIKMWFIYDARMRMLENERRQGLSAHQQPVMTPEDAPEA